jgi:aminopeptidase
VRDRSADVERLADLLVGFGANLQPGQILGVTAYLGGMEDAARAVARAAYKRGAKYVDVLWWDLLVKRARLELADESTLEYVPPWLEERMEWLGREHAARVSLTGTSAGVFEGIDPARTGRDLLPSVPASLRIINERTTNWTAGPCPNPGWAARVHPELEPDAALDKLWDEIVYVLRLDTDDPVEAWRERMRAIVASAARLTERRFDAMHLHGPGTDVTIGLMPSSKWLGADFTTVDGLTHYPNLPTEEVFTTPDPNRVEGHVSATKPLELYGSYIDGIRIEFEGGRAVKIDADQGGEALRAACSKDEGASRLGEIALVDKEGRIGPLGTVFYETLLDENAASHIALGNAYTFPLEDEADRARANTSRIHVDFMIGSTELDVDGITRDGDRVPVLRGGSWQI